MRIMAEKRKQERAAERWCQEADTSPRWTGSTPPKYFIDYVSKAGTVQQRSRRKTKKKETKLDFATILNENIAKRQETTGTKALWKWATSYGLPLKVDLRYLAVSPFWKAWPKMMISRTFWRCFIKLRQLTNWKKPFDPRDWLLC